MCTRGSIDRGRIYSREKGCPPYSMAKEAYQGLMALKIPILPSSMLCLYLERARESHISVCPKIFTCLDLIFPIFISIFSLLQSSGALEERALLTYLS